MSRRGCRLQEEVSVCFGQVDKRNLDDGCRERFVEWLAPEEGAATPSYL